MSLFKQQALTPLHQSSIFSQLNEDINNLFESGFPSTYGHREIMGGQWQPHIDIEQKDKEYVVRADVPGVDAKDIKVSMDNGVLSIEGKRETKTEENRENYRCIERSYGSFYRSLRLPETVESDKITARCSNGVLEVSVPKLASAKQKTIKVISD